MISGVSFVSLIGFYLIIGTIPGSPAVLCHDNTVLHTQTIQQRPVLYSRKPALTLSKYSKLAKHYKKQEAARVVQHVNCAAPQDTSDSDGSNIRDVISSYIAERSAKHNVTEANVDSLDRDQLVSYLKLLNNQFVSVETVVVMIDDYVKTDGALRNYRDALIPCLDLKKLKASHRLWEICLGNADRYANAFDKYYNFVDLVGSVREISDLPILRAAIDSLEPKLARLVDEISSIKAEIDVEQ